MDIKKAFDRVDVDNTPIALQDTGVHGRPMRFLRNYVRGRTFAVKLGATVSSPWPLHIGMPQGSILSPLFFNVALSHLLSLPSPRDPICVAATIYADDVCIWATNKRTTAALVLQGVINHLIRKLAEVGLRVAATKTRFALFRVPRVRVLPIILTMNGTADLQA